jgi:hypothetical protein
VRVQAMIFQSLSLYLRPSWWKISTFRQKMEALYRCDIQCVLHVNMCECALTTRVPLAGTSPASIMLMVPI